MIADQSSFLLSQGGPILRWLTAQELLPDDPTIDHQTLFADLLRCPEVCQWLNLLGSGPVHHSKDSSAENVMAKLAEYGFKAGLANLDERLLPYCAVGEGERYHDEALILVPFLVHLGYASEPRIAHWMAERIERLYELAIGGDYDFYMSESERERLPTSQRTQHGNPKLFYHQRFNYHWGYLGLPTCYDLYTLAYLPKHDPLTRQKVETIVKYLLHPAFQGTPGGYIWNAKLRRPYAAGQVFLACLPSMNEREKLVLFLEMLAHFDGGRACDWFQQGMAHLETFHTKHGTYRFPSEYLSEKHSYYLYAGMHMGLGETPRNAHALELESTFRMARIKKIVRE
jgi:hypothetical protein